jgi:hypothetical protein
MQVSRQRIRFVGAAASATMAVIYSLIGLRIYDIGGSTTGETVDLGLFGASAGSAFLALAVLLALTDRRWLWIPAVAFQVFVYAIYFGTSGTRVPPFEILGITLRIVQIPLVLALIYLTVKAPMSTRSPGGRDDPSTNRPVRIGA